MDFTDIKNNIVDQDKGVEFDILDPISGKSTGIKFKLAGPDSVTQHKACLAMADELAELAGIDGRITAENREEVRINTLARCVLDWKIKEGKKAIPFNHANVVRVLKAGTWLQAQVDGFASDRQAFGPFIGGAE